MFLELVPFWVFIGLGLGILYGRLEQHVPWDRARWSILGNGIGFVVGNLAITQFIYRDGQWGRAIASLVGVGVWYIVAYITWRHANRRRSRVEVID